MNNFFEENLSVYYFTLAIDIILIATVWIKSRKLHDWKASKAEIKIIEDLIRFGIIGAAFAIVELGIYRKSIDPSSLVMEFITGMALAALFTGISVLTKNNRNAEKGLLKWLAKELKETAVSFWHFSGKIASFFVGFMLCGMLPIFSTGVPADKENFLLCLGCLFIAIIYSIMHAWMEKRKIEDDIDGISAPKIGAIPEVAEDKADEKACLPYPLSKFVAWVLIAVAIAVFFFFALQPH